MLRIYDDAIRALTLLRPLGEKLRRKHKPLAEQLERAAISVPLNIAEGSYRRGRQRAHHYDVAIGSARECRSALDCGIALEMLGSDECKEALDALDKICATLWRCIG